MNYNNKLNDLARQVIASLVQIEDAPAEWLPHTVYVEEEGEDCDGRGIPVYNQYKLVKIHYSGACELQNVITNEIEERHLYEINIEWLITVLNRYEELIAEQCQQEAELSREEKLEDALRRILDVAQLEITGFAESETYRICEEAIDTPVLPKNELRVVVYSMDRFARDISNEELLMECKNNPDSEEIRVISPDKFACEINDESFNDQKYWVRFMEV